MNIELLQQSMEYLWHPCSQMKDYESFKPIVVKDAHGSYIETMDGKKIIDAISSWWCKSLGHAHPRLKNALLEQLEKFEHVLLVNTVNEKIVNLSKKLAQLTQSLNKIFYASDGSCAIEIALKMSLHAHQIQGKTKKTKFIALENSYHGETIGALSVSDVGIYRDPYKNILFDTYFISPIPYVSNVNDALWQDCSSCWDIIEKKLEPYIDSTTALIVEPIIQGAGGMKIYSQDFLQRLRTWTAKHHIHLIADEIMTGIGRTGKILACEYANIEPDLLCLGKGLTAGWMPFSAVAIRDDFYQLFYNDYSSNQSFLHSHTYSGNVMAASIALEVFNIVEHENICAQANLLGKVMHENMLELASQTNKLSNVRYIGAMVAADLICESTRRVGFEIYQEAIKRGALLRPLGNTIYWLPPLNADIETINSLSKITKESILAVDF